MPIQTGFSYSYDKAFAGMLWGIGLRELITGVSADPIPFGRAVVFDDSQIEPHEGRKPVKLPSASSDRVIGIARHIHTEPTGLRTPVGQEYQNETSEYLPKSAISIVEQGKIYVEVEDDVSPGDPVFVRFASGAGGDKLGAFRKDADTSTAVALENAEFVTSTTTNGIAVIHIYK
jgi:hypothetical protein